MRSAHSTPVRPRTALLLTHMGQGLPRLSIERAKHFTTVFRQSECLSLPLRWARALRTVMERMPVIIQPHELLVGRAGPTGCYGIFYPELEGAYFAEVDALQEEDVEAQYSISPEDMHCLRQDIVPYWVGRTFREGLAYSIAPELRHMLYKNGNIYEPSCIIHESATVRHSLQWVLDYKKIVEHGFEGIYADAEARLSALSVDDPQHSVDKAPFYEAVMELCRGVRTLATRYAVAAEDGARQESDPVRADELRTIAAVCRRVPWQGARTFHEALQAQWFTQLVSRLEQMHGGIIGNGRMDQYLLPFYTEDKAAGRLTDDHALELLDCLWCHIAQFKRVQLNATGLKLYEGHAHWEHTTIGGQLPQGGDATNALTLLLLRSWREFPLDYPDLGVRMHKNTPDAFLSELCSTDSSSLPTDLNTPWNKRAPKGLPKLLNDEEIIPRLVQYGASPEEAHDYCGSGCSEARCINRHTYMSGTTWFNLGAVLEMTLLEGHCQAAGEQRLGLATPPAVSWDSFDVVLDNFFVQLRHVMRQVLAQQYMTDALRTRFLAAPLVSALHDLCMKDGRDINEGRIAGGISLGGQVGPIGFATVVDSLCAIRHLVFDEGRLSMSALLEALSVNFEGHETVRALCVSAPKYGNGIPWVDALARRLESFMVGLCREHRNFYGGQAQLFYVPVTCHRAMGRVTGATADGRRAGDVLSEGVSPSQGAAFESPLGVLQSASQSKAADLEGRAARFLVLPLSPAHVRGDKGRENLKALIRLWVQQRHWHLQVRMDNADHLLAARNTPEKFRYWNERLPGHSAAHACLSHEQQESLIKS